MDNLENGKLQWLEPQEFPRFYELTAVPKSGLTQYGSVPVNFSGAEMRASVGYRRYHDCDRSDTPGQDFAVARWDHQYLVGVLADGVGQSFYGNLAAERVCSWLLPHLWESRANPPGEDELEAGLKQAEQDFSGVIEGVSLAHLPDWHQNALEATRRSGSQAVFAAVIWEFPRQRGCLYQVGDAIAVVQRGNQCEQIDAPPKGRWSSAGKSQLHLLRTPLQDTTAILLKSDGADPHWGDQIERQTADGSEFLEMAARRAENDDVSFVAGCLITGVAARPTERRRYEERPPSRGLNSIYASESLNPGESRVPVAASGARPAQLAMSQSKPAGPPPPTRVPFEQPPDSRAGKVFDSSRSVPRSPSRVLIFGLGIVVGLLLSLAIDMLMPFRPPKLASAPNPSASSGGSPSPDGSTTAAPKSPKPSADSDAPSSAESPASDQSASDASVAKVTVRISPPAKDANLPPGIREYLKAHPKGAVLGIQSINATLSGIGITGVGHPFAVHSAGSGRWSVYIPETGAPGSKKNVPVVHFYQPGPDGREKDVKTVEVPVPPGQYRDILLSADGR